jgi:hypothetical protein
MDNDRIIKYLKEVCQTPEPENKEVFFQRLEERGLTSGRPVVINHGDFLLRQFPYIGKWIWLLSSFLLLFIIGICYGNTGNYPFALTPLLAIGTLIETGRSFRWKMAELEHSARFSLRSVMLARMFLVGIVETAGLLVVIWVVRPWFSYSLIRVFLYMMVPYLAASLSGSVYERKNRSDNSWGSILICFLSSGLFAAAPYCLSSLYEERFTVIWTVAFILLVFSLVVSMRRWICELEEAVWN